MHISYICCERKFQGCSSRLHTRTVVRQLYPIRTINLGERVLWKLTVNDYIRYLTYLAHTIGCEWVVRRRRAAEYRKFRIEQLRKFIEKLRASRVNLGIYVIFQRSNAATFMIVRVFSQYVRRSRYGTCPNTCVMYLLRVPKSYILNADRTM